MGDIPIIGQNQTTSDDPEFASLSEEDREALAAMANEHPEDVDEFEPCATAFLVILHTGGEVEVTPDVTRKVAPNRVASGDDIIAASAVAHSDLQASKTAQVTAIQMAQMGRLMQEQQQAEAIRQRMAANQAGGFKNL